MIRAAAGCGKTTQLATAYLGLLREGHAVDQVIAITFTRRAAAELIERVGLALQAAAGDPTAIDRLGAAAQTYLDAAPSDPDVARSALADLGSAPIGTTDKFVNDLLAEYALLAELELADHTSVALDVDLKPVPDLKAHLDAAARALIDPPDLEPPDQVHILSPYFTLAEIHGLITRTSGLDALPVASCEEVLRWLAAQVATTLQEVDLDRLRKAEEPWDEALARVTNKGAEWTLPAVQQWIEDGARADEAPWELAHWVRKLHQTSGRFVHEHLAGQVFDFGIATVRMDHLLGALKHPYEDLGHLRTADALREAIEHLRVQVASEALAQAALAGELSHDHLTRCAARLARRRELAGRFTALLVDEVQDANPDQLELYEALAGQPGMASVFVGDTRQSIYLFRGGEPKGLAQLARRATRQDLALTNFRSTPPLVDAQRALFGALDAPLRSAQLTPLEPVHELESDPARADDVLSPSHPGGAAPVHVVWDPSTSNAGDANANAIRHLWQRLQHAWSEPGHAEDTAAVLCPTWRDAAMATELLRQLSGDADLPSLEGGDRWVKQGIGRDVGFFLRALADPNDDIAWLAVLKHPSVGLTDAALARIRANGSTLGSLLWNALGESHDQVDQFAFERAIHPLRSAHRALGREHTADVLDELFTQLSWRALLHAGPDGEDQVARLDVLLDWIGDADADGRGVDGILSLLDEGTDVPRVNPEHTGRRVACTTIFQAKGLAWDHVAVLSPGRSGRATPDTDVDLWIDLNGERKRLVGLRFDPEGGLLPYQDPIKRLIAGIQTARYTEEGIRLAYVGMTRARRSVTIGLPNRPRYKTAAQEMVIDAWKSLDHPAIQRVPPPPEADAHPQPRRAVHAVDPFPRFQTGTLKRFTIVPPSAAAARLSDQAKADIATHIATRVALAGGRLDGTGDCPPPVEAYPELSPADWGVLVHGWFAAWGFRGAAEQQAIATWLAREWGFTAPPIADWLHELSARLVARGGPAWDLVNSDGARLIFEVPVIGLGGPRDDLFLAGRPDLLVVRKKRVSIVDFKAGSTSPQPGSDLAASTNLAVYGPQLEAYREVLERRGYTVDRTMLWFVRTGGVVQW